MNSELALKELHGIHCESSRFEPSKKPSPIGQFLYVFSMHLSVPIIPFQVFLGQASQDESDVVSPCEFTAPRIS
jgi:hypothetical protein